MPAWKKSQGKTVWLFWFFWIWMTPLVYPNPWKPQSEKKVTLRPRRCSSVRLTVMVINSNAMKHLPVFSTDFNKPKQRCVGEDLRFPCCQVPVLAQSSQLEVASRHRRDGRWHCGTPEVMGTGTVPQLERDSGTCPCLLVPLLLHCGSHPMDRYMRLLPGLIALPSHELRVQDAGTCFSFALVPHRNTVTISSPLSTINGGWGRYPHRSADYNSGINAALLQHHFYLGGTASAEAVICLTQAYDGLYRTDLILHNEQGWRYHVGNLFKDRNVGCVKTEIKDRGGIFWMVVAEGMVLTKDFWNLRVYSSKSHVGQREKLLEEDFNFSLFLGFRKFPP